MDRRSKIIVGAIALAVVAASAVVLWLSQPTDEDRVALTSPTPSALPSGFLGIPEDDGTGLGPIPAPIEDGADQQPSIPPVPSTEPVNMTAETGPNEIAAVALLVATAIGMGGLIFLTRRYT